MPHKTRTTNLTAEIVRELLSYDSDTGLLVWKRRDSKWFDEGIKFTPEHCANLWNNNWAGKPALNSHAGRHGRNGSIFGVTYRAHQVIWLWVYGEWPKGFIDHINGDACDNRLANLRVVTNQENCKNQKFRRTNTSGVMGVYWFKQTGTWLVKIGGKHVGMFKEKEAAIAARKAAEVQLGYHPNHGQRS